MTDLTIVNPQIKDAVTTTNTAVLGASSQTALGAVRQQVAQSTGLAIQDAVDQLQQLMVLNSAVTGKALSILLAPTTTPEQAQNATSAMTTIQGAVQQGISWFESVGQAASGIIQNYPSA